MSANATSFPDGSCPYCGGWGHNTFRCPRVAAVEYHPNGTLKRIELHPLSAVPPSTRSPQEP